ncbi:MAG: hypothetical protein H0W14_09350 [Actinobacteria bacterium]|nr:hypothetical protein [Actinomycetota bacterium]
MATLRERIDGDDLLFDSWIVSHGYALYSRDYDIVVNVPAALPPGIPIGDTVGSYFKGQYRFRFTHCPEVHISSSVTDETWRTSWDDLFADYEAWEAAGNPEGFVWGVKGADAYPGLSYVADSPSATSWTERLGHEMHEVTVETNTFVLRLVCHDLQIEQLAVGDPVTRTLKPVETN